jgi:DNA primase
MSRGRIHPESVAAVREKTDIEAVISDRVTLRRTGANLTGLCPFHDDSSPSFSVSPDKGLWTCFGCGLGGDVISFIQQAEGLPFVEAVESLADRFSIELRYLDAGDGYVAPPPGQRRRLAAANAAAVAFFRSHLSDPDAEVGRRYLGERAIDAATAAGYEVGWAPNARDALLSHLKGDGFTVEEIVLAGLAVQNDEGRIYDRFRGRLVWPIRDLTGDVVGFGARKLREDDQGPKWLNTPDTPLYRKSEVLYGIDRARKDIATSKTVVVVEGYGDVMACHLSGIATAVATCGTAFGDGHIRIVRRLMRDDDAYTGKVIFTFDGDAAGQKAALRAFRDNAKFTAQTYVAVAPDGMDPLDLRLARGEQAVRDLIAAAVPLVEFVLRTTLNDHDLSVTEGRVTALRATAPIVAGIRDSALRTEYIRRLSGWLSLPDHTVLSAVSAAERNAARDDRHAPPTDPAEAAPRAWRPDPADETLAVEREAAKCLLQVPAAVGDWWGKLEGTMFTAKAYRGVYSLATRALAEELPADARLHRIRDLAADNVDVAAFINELAIEPLRAGGAPDDAYAPDVIRRLIDQDLARQLAEVRGRFADANPDEQSALLASTVALEARRRELSRR